MGRPRLWHFPCRQWNSRAGKSHARRGVQGWSGNWFRWALCAVSEPDAVNRQSTHGGCLDAISHPRSAPSRGALSYARAPCHISHVATAISLRGGRMVAVPRWSEGGDEAMWRQSPVSRVLHGTKGPGGITAVSIQRHRCVRATLFGIPRLRWSNCSSVRLMADGRMCNWLGRRQVLYRISRARHRAAQLCRLRLSR